MWARPKLVECVPVGQYAMRSAFFVAISRSLPRRTVLLSRCAAPRLGILKTQFPRFASTTPQNEPAEALKVQQVVDKLNQNPEIREILNEFQRLLAEKGFNTEKPPSFMEMMRLFSQKDVRELASRLKAKFDEAGIEFTPDQMSLFMGMFKK